MPKLQVDLNVPWFQSQFILDLTVSALGPQPADRLYVFTGEKILHKADSVVFQGSLKCEDWTAPRDVVCKMVRGDPTRLQAEAEFYNTALKDVRNTMVPRFLDYWSGISRGVSVGCLLLEYCGEALHTHWLGVPMPLRYVVVESDGLPTSFTQFRK